MRLTVRSPLINVASIERVGDIVLPFHTEDDDNGAANNGALILRPVAPEESGEGLPYAPENWPNPGDVWGWRTGKRVAITGHFKDRYLYLPAHLCRADNPGSSSKRRRTFASKHSVERYIQESFPDVDLNAFFASFSWKVPAIQSATRKVSNADQRPIAAVPFQDMAVADDVAPDCQSDIVGCKAGNKKCDGLMIEEEKYSPDLPCDVFCSKRGFCHYCCCILCCKTVDSSSTYGGCSYIKCQEKIGEFICGHIAHIDCALRCCLAGTVGGSIGLDVEYHCRHCDGRTDLISHANKLLQKCKTINSRDDIEKILNLGACVLRGSQKTIAKELLGRIELALSKLKCGTHLEDIWKVDDKDTTHYAGFSDDGNVMEVTVIERPSEVITGTESYGYLPYSLKLEEEIDQVLQALRKSQEFEYEVAEEVLQSQKNYLQNLYRQLDSEKSELARQHSSHSLVLFDAVRERKEQDRKEQIRLEVMKFQDMKMVANGFGRTSKDILKVHFGLEIAD